MKAALFAVLVLSVLLGHAYAQSDSVDSPFERKFGNVKFLDGYFGTIDEKLEVNPGDDNVPFTVVMANVGTYDITGIRGQLSMPLGFSSSDGPDYDILADASANPEAGQTFYLTFYVNIDEHVRLGQHKAAVKVDYSRLRESGLRSAVQDFAFRVTGDSIINMKAPDPFLVSLKNNHIVMAISNDGTAPASAVDIQLINTPDRMMADSQQITNVDHVVIQNTHWDIGRLDPGSSKAIETDIYIPESLYGETFRAPMSITYFNAHGDQTTISRVVDFYVRGLVDLTVYNVGVIDLSGMPTVVGEIINEGNEDALFSFVSVDPRGGSNIKSTTQFIDEIEVDSPVPFNVPVEFEGAPRYGDHDITVTIRYKDDVREEHFLTYEATISVAEPQVEEDESSPESLVVIAVIVVAVIAFVIMRRRKRSAQATV